jgi:hypothetical protein
MDVSWIDDDIKARGEIEARAQLINTHAEGVYNDLWKEILERVTEAKNKGIQLYTNGTPFSRIVGLGDFRPPKEDSRRELVIGFRKDYPSGISVSNRAGTYALSVDVCDDNVVCLKLSGKPITMHDAGIYILRSFIFPDVVSKENNESAKIKS